ncbi:MAG: hypothetical protein KJ864_06455, partial [Candidatus Omnitrophica bacterium]|nr:hypothetical protein [Candidatus Omnitrophota bacterium]
MVSGEGKTLAAIMPAYLNALTGKSVHIHTVNEYLAKRDANLMGRVFNFLGLSTGVITQGAKERLFNNSYLFNNICIRQRTAEFKFLRNSNFLVGGKPCEYVKKKEVYDADIIYGYSREIVFDYLRDVLVNKTTAQVSQKQIALTIVDEGDSILIDGNIEPLVIAVPADGNFLNYVFKEIYELSKDCVYDVDYELNYRDKTATLSRNGKSFFKKAINENKYLKDLDLDLLVVFLENAIASEGYVENVDYVVPRDRFGRKKVVVYDETSGKLKPGSIWENGLHQFIELKHNCKLTAPSTVVISICYKNYYDKLCNLAAMSGTLRPVANELKEYYGLEFLKVPKRNESLRKDLPDVITLTDATKWKLIVSDIEQKHKIGRPVYVGTRSIKEARWLKKEIGKIGIKANLFDGLDPENEEKIIMNAGEPGAVTITTQLGGRGVDVELGEEVRAKGGLYVIGVGSYRDERIKKQLQLRAGRGADPGSTRFYISLQEEDLIHFGGKDIPALKKEIKEFKKKFKIDENVGIWKKILARKMQYGLEKIQKGICQYKTNIRKRAMRVDDILDDKRQFFYYMKMLNRYDGRMIQANLIKLNNIWISFLDSIWKKRNICSLYKTEYENMCYKEFQKMIKEIKNKPYLYEKEFNAKRNVNLRALLELIKQDAEKEEIGIFESEDQQLKLVNTAMGLNLTISDKNYERTVEILKKSKNKIKLHDFKNVVKNETEEVLRLNEMPENGWHEKNSSESLESGTIVEAFEECLIVSILREQNFNVKKTADVLNISTGYLIFKLLEIESRFKELPNLEIIKNETENIDVETSFIEKQLLLDVSAHDYKLNISLKGFSAEIATMTLKDCFQSIIKFMKGENPKLNLMSLKEKIGNEVMKVILCKLKEKGKDVSYMSKLAEVDKCYLEQLMKTNKLNLSNAEEEYAKESIVLFDAEIDFLDLKNRVMRGIEERVILYSLSRAKNDSKTAAEKLLMSKEEFDAKIKSIIITQCRNRARVVFEQEDFLEESFGQRAKEEYLGIIKDFEYFVDERNPKINLINVKERISNQIKCVFISKALHETKGNTEKAAKLLKISKRGLWDIIKRHNLIYPEVTQEYVKMKKFFNGEDLNKTVMEMSRKVEKWGVSQALKLSKGNRTRAAESVGIGRRQFTDWLKEIKEGIVECESELFYEKARIFLHELFEELEPYYDFHSQVASDSFFVEIDISDSESLEEEKLEES